MTERLPQLLPWPVFFILKKAHALPEDLPVLVSFLRMRTKTPTTFWDRLKFLAQCYAISYAVDSPHMEGEIVKVAAAILSLDLSRDWSIVEAGAYKGGSAAKLSIVARLANRRLFVFDSFAGIPPHTESAEKNIFGGDAHFPPGSYFGSLDEVHENIEKFGEIDSCLLIKGWFDETMPRFAEPIGIAFVDVDLRSSTATCLKFLFPLLVPGGSIFSHDGHLPRVIKLLEDSDFWERETRHGRPDMIGLGKEQLVEIRRG